MNHGMLSVRARMIPINSDSAGDQNADAANKPMNITYCEDGHVALGLLAMTSKTLPHD